MTRAYAHQCAVFVGAWLMNFKKNSKTRLKYKLLTSNQHTISQTNSPAVSPFKQMAKHHTLLHYMHVYYPCFLNTNLMTSPYTCSKAHQYSHVGL